MSISARELSELGYEIGPDNIARKKAASVKVKASEPARKAAIRMPSHREPNKTEQRLEQRLRCMYGDEYSIRYEAITFRLAAGVNYTADYTVWLGDRIVAAYEAKGAFIGHSTRSIMAFKTASAEFPDIKFVFAQWKGGEWLMAGAKEGPEALL